VSAPTEGRRSEAMTALDDREGHATLDDREGLQALDDCEGLQALDETRYVAYYDRLRRRILLALGRGGRPARWAEPLLLAPDVFMLLVWIFFDREVPRQSRQLVGGALAYFLLPADLLPEMFLGAGGFLDDVLVAAAVLSHVFSADLGVHADRHWSGSADLRGSLEDAVAATRSLLGHDLYGRVRRMLGRRGVEIP